MSKTQQPVAWHNQELPVLLADFETNPQGLEQDDAAARLLRYGPNRSIGLFELGCCATNRICIIGMVLGFGGATRWTLRS